ncbi:heat shock transcription factor, Y-linked-like [Camelus ferus]|uniref:Heat shock transcription factor, Y-linked-like n=1 Tax=Camelus ferus TaxID=419612 RepID=A0A8B8SPH8_CAMFR|nr:heat shock transcription factor, Y-linked-like [Camelus ferus]
MAHVSSEIQDVSPKDGPNGSGKSCRSLLCDQIFSRDLDLRSMIEENAFQTLCEELLRKRPCYTHCVSEPDEDNDFRSLTFPRKLWKMVGSDQFQSIWWDDNGTSIVINEDVFKKEVLERKTPFRIFETGIMKSLLRQLNLYRFSKVRQNFPRSACLADFLAEEKEVSVLSKYSTLSPIQSNYLGLMVDPSTFPNTYHNISANEGPFSKFQAESNPLFPMPVIADTSAISLSWSTHQPTAGYERHPNYNCSTRDYQIIQDNKD